MLARTLSEVRSFGKSGYTGQYHSQSDHHSKVACWGILFDLLQDCQLLRDHVSSGAVTFGLNHEMSDWKQHRKKNLDLVLARPADAPTSKTFGDLGNIYGLRLDDEERARLDRLPSVLQAPVGSVLMALEAKAAMTAHIKARPRLYDELNSSHLTVHGAADQALAVGLAMINASASFISPGHNKLGMSEPSPHLSHDKQPQEAERTLQKIRELPRRTRPGDTGFDAIGVVMVECRNDGSPVVVVDGPPAPRDSDDDDYTQMIRRVSSLYAFRFSSL